jgi:hypothetical protein
VRLRLGVAVAAAIVAGSLAPPAHAVRVASVSANSSAWCVPFFLLNCMPVELSGGVEQLGGGVPAVMWCAGASPLATQITVSCHNQNDETVEATSVGSAAVASTALADNFPTESGSAMCITVTATWRVPIDNTQTFVECFPGNLIEI